MRGRRPLTDEEIESVVFEGAYASRDKALFVLGIKTGLRVSELLSLRVKDLTDRVQVARRNTKGKVSSRSVVYHPDARAAVDAWITEAHLGAEDPVFKSRRGSGPIGRIQAWKILKAAFEAAMISGPTGTHSLRKTFAKKIYAALDKDLVKTQAALGHRDVNSTAQYLSFETEEVDSAVLSI